MGGNHVTGRRARGAIPDALHASEVESSTVGPERIVTLRISLGANSPTRLWSSRMFMTDAPFVYELHAAHPAPRPFHLRVDQMVSGIPGFRLGSLRSENTTLVHVSGLSPQIITPLVSLSDFSISMAWRSTSGRMILSSIPWMNGLSSSIRIAYGALQSENSAMFHGSANPIACENVTRALNG